MAQLALNLTHADTYRPEDFLVSASNHEAHAWMESWPNWPTPAIVVAGPAGSGKTHLAHLWAERSHAAFLAPRLLGSAQTSTLLQHKKAIVLDGLEEVEDEAAIYHLLNHIKETGTPLLLTSQYTVPQLGIKLADAASRLAALPWVTVKEPDETLLAAVLTKWFSDQQLRVPKEVIDYLVRRMERSFTAAHTWAERINREAFQRAKPVTIPMIRSLLEEEDRRSQDQLKFTPGTGSVFTDG